MATPTTTNESSPISTSWGYTQVKVTKFSYTWTIENFSFYEEKFVSPVFGASAHDKLKWSLKVTPKYNEGLKGDNLDYVRVQLLSCNDTPIKAKFKVCVLKAKKPEFGLESQRTYEFSKEHRHYGWNKFIKRSVLMDKTNGFLTNDRLILFCEVCAVGDIKNSPTHYNCARVEVPGRCCGLSEDFGNLFDGSGFTDVTLCVGGKQLQAHKCVLAARSPVFSAMFEHKMKEKKQGRVEITDIDHKVLTEMLRYIYTGKAPNLDKMANKLLAAADKYALGPLKSMCEEALCLNLTVKNAPEVLVVADLHCAEQLKTHAIYFIKSQAQAVMDTDEWKSMVVSHPHVVTDFCRALADQTGHLSLKRHANPPRRGPKRKRAKRY